LEFLSTQSFDLGIFDVGLPDGAGFEIAEFLRTNGKELHFIFLTAQGDAESRLQGYELGAEEYIPKPFHLKELLMRVEHVMHRHAQEKIVELPTCQVFLGEMKIVKKTGAIEYPPVKDIQVLSLLIKKSPEAVSRDEILDIVWGPDKDLNHRTVDNTIVRLKKTLGDEQDQMIRSVRGVGYQWIYHK
jgi:DNA-binding response OmpR family regulator